MPTATPESPPKRITRARAKAVEETKTATVRPTKPSVATTSKAIAARNAKRKTRPEEDDTESPEDPPARTRTTVTRSKPQDARSSNSSRPATTSRKNTKAGSSATSRLATASSTAKSIRSRQAGAAAKSQEKTETNHAEQPPARATRARTGSVTNNNQQQNPVAPRKKVTFQDTENEKENVPATQVRHPKSNYSVKPNGIKDRPARNPPPKSAIPKADSNISGAAKPEPLSPRKNVQVAQTAANEAATPTKNLHKSSIRPTTPTASRAMSTCPENPQITTPGAVQPEKEEDLDLSMDELQGSTALFTSPTKANVQSSNMMSPPKRPAVSPHKGSLSVSPRKFDSGGFRQQEELSSIPVESTLSRPPRKFPISEPRKNKALDLSSGYELTNTSLWSSPAKKPLSPSKKIMSNNSTSGIMSPMKAMTPSFLQQSPRKALFTPAKNITSALRAMKSPESYNKVYKMTPAEQAKLFEDELAATASPCSNLDASTTEIDIEPLSCMAELPTEYKRCSDNLHMNMPCPSSPENIGLTTQCVSNQFDPALCPSPSSEGNASMLEAVFPTKKPEEQTNGYESDMHEDVESDDELQAADRTTYFPSPIKTVDVQLQAGEPVTPKPSERDTSAPNALSMTTLAERFGDWKCATPDQTVVEKRRIERSMFTPLHPIVDGLEGEIPATPTTTTCTEADETMMDDSIAILEDENESMVDSPSTLSSLRRENLKPSQTSDAAQEYGDENLVPIDPSLLVYPEPATATCTPARVFEANPKIVHTVCKVPLKPAAEDGFSLRIKPIRRTHSLSGELSAQSALELEALQQISSSASESTKGNISSSSQPRVSKFSEMLSENVDRHCQTELCATPSDKTETWSAAAATPARTPRPGLNTKLLTGAVVFVDVHTSEGADASGIFVELLQQMGAKCVKQWNWSSRNSLGGKENAAGDLAAFGSTRVGITHVVFKDGGKRTMEKVREAKGLVLCVGVGWVLDCEKENKWLDEAEYAVDSSTIPRGGSRRRKSMEPKALSSATFAPLATAPQLSPTKEFLDLSSPVNRRATITGLPKATDGFEMSLDTPKGIKSPAMSTPRPNRTTSEEDELLQTPAPLTHYDEATVYSPTTPYFMHPEQLVQQTCPPKQSQRLLFPLSGRIEDEPDERLRQRLLLARRKSLQWAPKVASPLSRAHSYQ